MIFIEIIQNSGGRTGHKLKDYLTAFCFYFICNYKIIINDCWKFPENNCNNHLNMFNLISSDIFVNRPNDSIITIKYSLKNWQGMKYYTFKEITKRIEDTQSKNIDKSIIVQLSRATRIQLSDVYNWELSNLIEKRTYSKLTLCVRSQLLTSPNNNQLPIIKNKNIINISIHIRKGDVFHRSIHRSVKYYENIIKNLKKLEFKKHIYIFSEKWKGYDGEDVFDLINLKDNNTNIEVIFEVCLYEYFVDIINSDIFVATIGQGSFSDMAIHYKSKNTIVILNNLLRQNKFNDDMNNMLIKTEQNGDFDIKYLQNNVHLKLSKV